MAVVEFVRDIYPYCKGDVVDLDESERQRIAEVKKQRSLEDTYVIIDVESTVETEPVKAEAKAKK